MGSYWIFTSKFTLCYFICTFGLVWFGLVLWHINPCCLFNAKACFYIYSKYMIRKHILLIHTVKWSKSSISKKSFLGQYLFAHSLNPNFYLSPTLYLLKCSHSGQEWTWEQRQWRDTPYSLNFPHYLNLTITLFRVIQDTHWSEGQTPLQRCNQCYMYM